MKKFNLLTICLIVLGATLFTSCKKDKDPKDPSQAELLLGKWKLVSIDNVSTVNGQVVSSDTYIGKAQDFIDVVDNKTANVSIDGNSSISEYVILPNNKLAIDDEIGTIKVLNSNTFTLYIREESDNNTFDESTFNFKK